MIVCTITPKLLERAQPGVLESRRAAVGRLPTVEEFARAIVTAALDTTLPSGHTRFVGATEERRVRRSQTGCVCWCQRGIVQSQASGASMTAFDLASAQQAATAHPGLPHGDRG